MNNTSIEILIYFQNKELYTAPEAKIILTDLTKKCQTDMDNLINKHLFISV